MNYVGPAPDVSYYDVAQMYESERKQFLVWHETVAKEVFDNTYVRKLLQGRRHGAARRAAHSADTLCRSRMWKCSSRIQ
jgi:hypothetical protein